jgi:catalase
MSKDGTLGRWAAIGALLLALLAVFAYVGGWLTASRLTQARLMRAFDQVSGPHPGYRRNHAKGVCAAGWFDGNGQLSAYSKAAIFKESHVPVIGRFALAGGLPLQSDTPDQVRSLALKFAPRGGEEWRTGMNNIPVFPVRTAQGFYDQLLAAKVDPATGQPDPGAMQAFLTRHPEAGPAFALIKSRPITAGFVDATYNSLNAFRLVNAAGASSVVRWALVPVQGFAPGASAMRGGAFDRNYLFDDLIAELGHHPLTWHLVFTLAGPGDAADDPTVPWPPGRRQIDAGLVTIDHLFSEDAGNCTDVNYDPLVLPAGIEPSDDPLLAARSAAYARSFTMRSAEKPQKAPSAVTPAEIFAGTRRP